MRDALSIFDQLVSFCGTTISYEQAIEVLNVLDTDYYFRLVDATLMGNVSGALLLLNEVLQKGFDVGHFVTGFAQHLRDVLVSKDAATVQLLETSEAIRQHYQEQAQRCNAKWIFNALDIINTCDIQYRTAKNKRLTVELALVKLCRLTEPVDAVPVQKTAAPAKPTVQTAPTVAPSREAAATTPAPRPATNPSAAKPAATMPSLGAMPSIGNLGMVGQTPPTNQTTPTTQPANNAQQRNNPFTADQLIDAWVGLNKHFKKEERLLAMLSACQPILVNPELCRITVANPWQKQEFARFGKQLMDIVRDTLQNDLLKLQVEVAEFDRSKKAYTASEKYKLLTAQNPHLAELKTILNLQLE